MANKTKSDAEKAYELLTAMGVAIPEEVTEKLENVKEDNAFHKIEKALASSVPEKERNDVATAWQEDLFRLSSEMVEQLTGERVNVGQGNKMRRQLVIETSDGTLTVKLIQD